LELSGKNCKRGAAPRNLGQKFQKISFFLKTSNFPFKIEIQKCGQGKLLAPMGCSFVPSDSFVTAVSKKPSPTVWFSDVLGTCVEVAVFRRRDFPLGTTYGTLTLHTRSTPVAHSPVEAAAP
jgi:hypothetical protein